MISDETNRETSWKTLQFRQNVVNKIEEAIQMAGMPTSKTSREMEVQVFQKAKSRDEYLSFVARLILRVREMRTGGQTDETNRETSWKTLQFRQNVVNKIEEAIQMAGMPTSKTSREMEVQVFQKAKSRDEYLSFVARLILRVREMRTGGQTDETNRETSWKTLQFRQNVVNKIEEAIQMAGMPTSKTSREMEVQVFQKAKSRDEYLSFVARLILRVREMNNSIPPAANSSQNIVQNNQNIPDPINVLRNLANQGTGGLTMGAIP